MAGKIIADTIETGAGADISTSYVVNGSAKHWINFNGTGTPAARDSFNCSSITDKATGQYDINYTNNMSDANNAPLGVSNNNAATNNFAGDGVVGIGTTNGSMALGISTSGYSFGAYRGSGYIDAALNQGATHGDLA